MAEPAEKSPFSPLQASATAPTGKFLPACRNCSGAQLSVLLSRIMNVTWVKVLASFSIEQSSIKCSSSGGPRFQGTHSANDLLLNALGEGTEKRKVASGCPTPHFCSLLCSPGAEVCRRGSGDLEVPIWTFTSVLSTACNKTEASVQVPLSPRLPLTVPNTHTPEKLPKCLKCSCTPCLYLFVV